MDSSHTFSRLMLVFIPNTDILTCIISEGQVSLSTSGLTPEQCLGARAMLRLKREELAAVAQVASATLFDFESGRRHPHPRTLSAIRNALEKAGVEFIFEECGLVGLKIIPKTIGQK